jgi:hypothetical protein
MDHFGRTEISTEGTLPDKTKLPVPLRPLDDLT